MTWDGFVWFPSQVFPLYDLRKLNILFTYVASPIELSPFMFFQNILHTLSVYFVIGIQSQLKKATDPDSLPASSVSVILI